MSSRRMGWIGNLKNENALVENFNHLDQCPVQDFGYRNKLIAATHFTIEK